MRDDRLHILNGIFPGRNEQITRLCRYFPQTSVLKLPSCIFLEGVSGSGRTAIIQKLMDISENFYIQVNCVECYAVRLLHFHLLYGLHNELEEEYEQIDSFASLYEHFQKFEDKQKLRCIIFKNSHLLNQSLLERLNEFHKLLISEGWNFSLVFASENCHNIAEFCTNPIRILFPPYSKDELTEILRRDQKDLDEGGVEILQNFLQFFLPTIAPIYSDLPEIKRLVQKFFPIYRTPIDIGVLDNHQLTRLGKSFFDTIKMQEFSPSYSYLKCGSNERVREIMDLPLCTKYLLVAAFLASFVPKNKDYMFMLSSSKRRRKSNAVKKNDKDESKLLMGPKSFKFSRLMFIYKAILGEKTQFNVNLISKVAALLELGLITQQSDQNRQDLNKPQYKCVANPSCVHVLAENIQVDLSKYLSF